ncbi:DNA polymerase I [Wohlfahrtiimonas larvae]|uniref:DNA polymerase I n=3 Tax=Wohlfahrtiimonas larvae TaxID=1157986 RepID=A0ABP9MEF7_9GAMM
MSNKTFLIIDGSNFLFRAYHALPPLTTKSGRPTGAIRGVITMFQKLLDSFDPAYVAVTFDAKSKSFRSDIYADYKAHRPPMPDDLREQIAPLMDVVDLLGLPRLIIDGIEADDVIATLAIEGKSKGYSVIIASSDKDLAQLVDDQIKMYDGMKNVMLDREGVFEKHGVYPESIRDYLTLMGDKADNIPGVEGVGPKTAAKWITEYQTLEGILANAEQIKGKVGERLRNSFEQIALSKKLTTLVMDAELPYKVEDLELRDANVEGLRELYTEFEFHSLLKQLVAGKSDSTFKPMLNTMVSAPRTAEWLMPRKPDFQDYRAITTLKDLDAYIARISDAHRLSIDTETDGLDFMQAKLVGISLSIATGEGVYIPVQHDLLVAPEQLALQDVITRLKPILENSDIAKVGQNLKFDWHILQRYGITLNGIADDTMLASYVWDATEKHNMDDLALKYLDHTTTPFEEIAGKGRAQKTFNEIPLEVATHYAAEDADITLRLWQALKPRVDSIPTLKSLYETIEMPLLTVLAKMEHDGILVNVPHLEAFSAELAERLTKLENEVYHLAGEEFNLSSPKQLGEILFGKLGLPVIKKTAKGQPSTNEEVLQELALDFPLPKHIIEYRELSKLKSTYTDALVAEVDATTQRIHTSFNQALTSTGRLSSSKPNLQNIPVRTEEGRKIRQAFIAKDGYKMISADYSQIELRLMAHFSGDETLIAAFKNDLDIHRATASEVFHTPLEEVSGDLRRSAKAINFGLIYGMGAFGLAKQLGIARAQAQDYIQRYFSRYPSILQFMEDAKEKARQLGYVETLLGRRLPLPDINSTNHMMKSGAERVAVNAPLQGTAADIIKLAMIEVDKQLAASSLDAKMLLQVHDELILEVVEKDAEAAAQLLKNAMEKIIELKVPLKVEVAIGDNWDEVH